MALRLSKIALVTAAFMTQGSFFLQATLTDTEELGLVKSTVPYAKPTATTQAWPASASSPTTNGLDSAKFGTATKTALTDLYWRFDGTDLFANSYVGDVWRTFKATSLAASWNATTALVLTETLRDGAAPGGGTEYTLTVNLAKAGTGSPADLLQADLWNFLKANKTKALTTITGTGVTLAGTLKTGWTATAVVKNDSAAAVAATLGVMEQGFTLPITISGATTATNFLGKVVALDSWNLATNSTTTKRIKFTSTSSEEVEVDFLPGPMLRTADTGDGILAALNNVLTGRFLATDETSEIYSLYNKGSDVGALLKNRFVTTDDAALDVKLNASAKAKFEAAGFVIGSFVTVVGTDYGLAAIGKATDDDITSVTWSSEGPKCVATGKIGTGKSKKFYCDLTGETVIKDDTNAVLEFKSLDGDIFYVKAFDATGIDTSAVLASMQDDMLAAELAAALTGVGTIDAKAIDAY